MKLYKTIIVLWMGIIMASTGTKGQRPRVPVTEYAINKMPTASKVFIDRPKTFFGERLNLANIAKSIIKSRTTSNPIRAETKTSKNENRRNPFRRNNSTFVPSKIISKRVLMKDPMQMNHPVFSKLRNSPGVFGRRHPVIRYRRKNSKYSNRKKTNINNQGKSVHSDRRVYNKTLLEPSVTKLHRPTIRLPPLKLLTKTPRPSVKAKNNTINDKSTLRLKDTNSFIHDLTSVYFKEKNKGLDQMDNPILKSFLKGINTDLRKEIFIKRSPNITLSDYKEEVLKELNNIKKGIDNSQILDSVMNIVNINDKRESPRITSTNKPTEYSTSVPKFRESEQTSNRPHYTISEQDTIESWYERPKETKTTPKFRPSVLLSINSPPPTVESRTPLGGDDLPYTGNVFSSSVFNNNRKNWMTPINYDTKVDSNNQPYQLENFVKRKKLTVKSPIIEVDTDYEMQNSMGFKIQERIDNHDSQLSFIEDNDHEAETIIFQPEKENVFNNKINQYIKDLDYYKDLSKLISEKQYLKREPIKPTSLFPDWLFSSGSNDVVDSKEHKEPRSIGPLVAVTGLAMVGSLMSYVLLNNGGLSIGRKIPHPVISVVRGTREGLDIISKGLEEFENYLDVDFNEDVPGSEEISGRNSIKLSGTKNILAYNEVLAFQKGEVGQILDNFIKNMDKLLKSNDTDTVTNNSLFSIETFENVKPPFEQNDLPKNVGTHTNSEKYGHNEILAEGYTTPKTPLKVQEDDKDIEKLLIKEFILNAIPNSTTPVHEKEPENNTNTKKSSNYNYIENYYRLINERLLRKEREIFPKYRMIPTESTLSFDQDTFIQQPSLEQNENRGELRLKKVFINNMEKILTEVPSEESWKATIGPNTDKNQTTRGVFIHNKYFIPVEALQ